MKIGIYGAGAIGGYLAVLLAGLGLVIWSRRARA